MKKSLLTLLFGLLISVTAAAQVVDFRVEREVDKDVKKIEARITLTKTEKEKYLKIKKAQITRHFCDVEEFKYKNRDLFKEKVQQNNEQMDSEMNAAFGKERAKEILDASRAIK